MAAAGLAFVLLELLERAKDEGVDLGKLSLELDGRADLPLVGVLGTVAADLLRKGCVELAQLSVGPVAAVAEGSVVRVDPQHGVWDVGQSIPLSRVDTDDGADRKAQLLGDLISRKAAGREDPDFSDLPRLELPVLSPRHTDLHPPKWVVRECINS